MGLLRCPPEKVRGQGPQWAREVTERQQPKFEIHVLAERPYLSHNVKPKAMLFTNLQYF